MPKVSGWIQICKKSSYSSILEMNGGVAIVILIRGPKCKIPITPDKKRIIFDTIKLERETILEFDLDRIIIPKS